MKAWSLDSQLNEKVVNATIHISCGEYPTNPLSPFLEFRKLVEKTTFWFIERSIDDDHVQEVFARYWK